MECEYILIYSLKGELILIESNFIVIQCLGVGYKCMCSIFTQESLKSRINKEVTVYTYLNVHQDAIELFGFHDLSELKCFKLLISVSGIGPKVALGILSHFSTNKIAQIISSEDSKSLTAAPGIGIKTAKRVILELKDKFSNLGEKELNESDLRTKKKSEALNALMHLGYSKAEIMPWLSNLSENLTVEEMIKAALQYISKGV